MSAPVLIGFAGVLVAAVATGVLAGRCVNQPRIYLILWTASTLGLAVALAAESMGFASGFGLATFRAVQLPTQLFAPLWLAWGLVELVVESEAEEVGHLTDEERSDIEQMKRYLGVKSGGAFGTFDAKIAAQSKFATDS